MVASLYNVIPTSTRAKPPATTYVNMRIPVAISAPVAIAPDAILAFPYMNISNLGGY